MDRRVIRYSEAFKLRVISELESGELSTIAEARKRYGIRGGRTIQCWLKKYGKNKLRSKVVTVNTPEDRDQTEELKKEIKQLKKTLAETQVQSVLNDAYFKVVCENHGITDPDEYKKKLDEKL